MVDQDYADKCVGIGGSGGWQHMRKLVIGLSGWCLALSVMSAGNAQEIWVKTDNMECTVSSDEALREGEAVTWTGLCADGRASGSGTLEVRHNNKLVGSYEGDMSGGKLHGDGILRLQPQDKNGFDRLEGGFVNGEPNGNARFDGANGDYFEGSFVNGERQGAGHYRLANGEEYFGDFENGKRSGVGFLIDAEGNVYIGQFENNLAHGAGVSDNADGSRFQGQFSENLPNGAGTYVAPNGDTYQGRFINAKSDGQFLVTRADGNQEIEIYKGGELVE